MVNACMYEERGRETDRKIGWFAHSCYNDLLCFLENWLFEKS